MALKDSLHGVTKSDLCFVLYLVAAVILVATISYQLAAAWFAPRCPGSWDIGSGWCLPIGFEGPFADVWANRSFFNARVQASAKFAILSLAFGIATYFWVREHPRAKAIAYFCGVATLIIFFTMGLLLNDIS